MYLTELDRPADGAQPAALLSRDSRATSVAPRWARLALSSALLTAICLAPGWASAQAVASFTVINADTGAEIATHPSNATVSLSSTPRINVRANARGVGSVVFSDSTGTRTENTAPYAYKGNNGPVYLPWSPVAGTYVINAKPFLGPSGSGTAGAAATLTLTVNGGSPPPIVGDKPATRNEAARFLAQATFGPTDADIADLMNIGYSAWIDKQFAASGSGTHQSCLQAIPNTKADKHVVGCFWKQAFNAPDQLRQRMAYALSQVFVISLADGDVDNYDRGVAAWMDGLKSRSFGTYRELLQYVSLSPMMGIYLSHLANQKADPTIGRVPDENYAREVMQLFSIGLVKLRQDGSEVLDAANKPVETYKPEDVSELAKVFTGLGWACPAPSQSSCFLRGEDNNDNEDPNRDLKLMVGYPAYHSTGPVTFLSKTINLSANPITSVTAALDHLAAQDNVAPFISRLLIQRFTTSNPSPAYISAVAQAFKTTGGDMKAVIKAVLTNPETRVVNISSGKLREPVLRLSAFVRAFPHTDTDNGKAEIDLTDSPSEGLAQAPLSAPSVFNFYRPGYTAPKSRTGAKGLLAPELQILNETSAAGYVNYMRDAISDGVGGLAGKPGGRDLKANYSIAISKANDPAALVKYVADTLTYGSLTGARLAEIEREMLSFPIPTSGSTTTITKAKEKRVHAAILLTVSTPEFIVLK